WASRSSRSSVYEVTTRSAPAMSSLSSAPRRASVSAIVTTVRPGANLAASAAQLGATLVGATTRNGAPPGSACLAWQIRASVSSVLPVQRARRHGPAGELAVQRPAEREAVQDRELGRGVPVAGVMVSGVSGGGFQPGTELGVADLVRPLPVEEAAGTARLPGSARWPASLSRSAWPRARRSATTPA